MVIVFKSFNFLMVFDSFLLRFYTSDIIITYRKKREKRVKVVKFQFNYFDSFLKEFFCSIIKVSKRCNVISNDKSI